MKVVIIGAAGFLGLHLARRAAEDSQYKGKNNVRLLDIQPFDKKEYKGPFDKLRASSFEFIKVDVRDKKALEKALKGATHVIHAAAALPLWSSHDIFAINVHGTRNVLDAAVKNKVKHVVYVSSTAVYGVPKKHPVCEGDPLIGVGAYGQSKIDAERVCEEYRKKGLVVTIIRPKTFVGTHRLGVFEILFDWVHDGKKIPVIGDGSNRYQLLEVDDLTEAIFRVLATADKKKVNDNFNIGAKKFGTVRADLEALFTYAGSGSKVMATPAGLVKAALWTFEKLRLSPLYQWVYDTADRDSFVSIDKLEKVLKWSPKTSNAQALIKSYQWYMDNYRKIKSRPAGVTHTVGWKQGILGLIKRFL